MHHLLCRGKQKTRATDEWGRRYSKREDVTSELQLREFDYVLTARAPATLSAHFALVQSFPEFVRVDVAHWTLQTRAAIHLMKNKQTRTTTATK